MKTVSELCNVFWEWRLRNFPLFSSFCGHHDFDDCLDAVLPEDILQQQEFCSQLLPQVVQAVTVPGVSTEDKKNAKLLIMDLKTFIYGVMSKGYLLPVNFMEGIQVEFQLVIAWSRFQTLSDYQKYLKRLKQLGVRALEVIEVLEEGIRREITCSAYSMKNVDDQLMEFEKHPRECFLFSPLSDIPLAIEEQHRKELQGEAEEIINIKVKPAMKKLRQFISETYMSHCRATEGVSGFANGLEYYQQCLRFHASTKITPNEVHEVGVDEVARIQQEMIKVKDSVGFGGTLVEFLSSMKTTESNFFKTKEEAMNYIKQLCAKIREKLPKLIKKIPSSPMMVAEVPENLKNNPMAYYFAGNADGSRPGVYYINTNDLTLLAKYELVALSLHEGEPGHHLQSMYNAEQEGVPHFRRHVQDHAYSLCPAHFPLHSALAEGWGLYCEGLGEEMGLYDDPFDKMGRLSMEIHRAMRLVVDTGIHTRGWTRERAISYMSERSALPRSFVENEVDRYITWPGQACAYKLGELKILELRRRAQQTLGVHFDVRDFHEALLEAGPVPLSVIEEAIDSYIQEAMKHV